MQTKQEIHDQINISGKKICMAISCKICIYYEIYLYDMDIMYTSVPAGEFTSYALVMESLLPELIVLRCN